MSLFRRLDVHRPTFIPSALLIGAFVGFTLLRQEQAAALFQSAQGWMSAHLGGWINASVNGFLLFLVAVALSPLGKIRIGGTHARPEFSRGSWLAMLFAAGMGIGLVYFSVAEPMLHFAHPIAPDAPAEARAAQAMQWTYFHYGVHVWAIYALVGIALGHAAFNRGLPLSLRSTLAPILGRWTHRGPGIAIDVLAVLATLFGLATSLGFGSGQFSAGLSRLTGIDNSTGLQVASILGITAVATLSVVSGLQRGVRRLSQVNMALAVLLFVTVLILGHPGARLGDFGRHLFSYFTELHTLSTYQGWDNPDAAWFRGWSLFYWTWWISWSPFVGTFIARISKGRTVREVALFAMALPALLSFLWMSTFGGLALDLELSGTAAVAKAVAADSSTGLFFVLEQLPASGWTSLVAIFLVAVFFITSSDSGSMVVDFMTSGGKLDSPKGLKVFWACMEGAVAIALLLGGGLAALQSAAISTGFPFSILLVGVAACLLKSLWQESRT